MCGGSYPGAGCHAPQPLGWYTDLGSTDSHDPNYLTGVRITVATASTLSKFGLIAGSDALGAHVQFGLYRDGGGTAGPTTLVASTNGAALVMGRNEVTPTTAAVALAPGDYWIMAVFDRSTDVGHDTGTSATWRYAMLAYGSALPTTVSTMSVTGVAEINFYVLVY